jgi:hypothetical protein
MTLRRVVYVHDKWGDRPYYLSIRARGNQGAPELEGIYAYWSNRIASNGFAAGP